MDAVILGLSLLADPFNILLIFVGVFVGILVGALPGLSSPMAVALLLPFTIFLAAVLLGAIHRWLGEPLGARFAGEVWDLARNLGIMLLTGAPFVAFVGQVNANAIADAKTSALQLPDLARGEEGYDHDNLDDGPPRSQRRR